MPLRGDPEIDWASTISGCVTDDSTATVTLSLPEVIERVSRDLLVLEEADYGVSAVVDPTAPDRDQSWTQAAVADMFQQSSPPGLAPYGSGCSGDPPFPPNGG